MSKKTEFKRDFERITKVFVLCNESYLVLRELYRTEDNSDFINQTKFKNSFFVLTKVNYWRVIVLQASKLFFDKGPFNIVKFLSKCCNGNHYATLNLDAKFIIGKLEFIDKSKYIIDELKIQRDKIIAHEDSNNIDIVNNVTLDEIGNLIMFCKDVIFHIYGELYDVHYDFEMRDSPEINLKIILKSLDKNHKIHVEKRKNMIKELIQGNKKINK